MTNEEAIEILIAVAVCDRPILSCDFCARYVGMGTDCIYPSDTEIEEAVLLLKGESNDAAISAIRQQEHFREVTKKVEPLTLDELRQMDGEPVYSVEITGREEWLFRRDGGFADMYGEFTSDDFMSWDNYGKLWWCYRQKPEEDDHA